MKKFVLAASLFFCFPAVSHAEAYLLGKPEPVTSMAYTTKQEPNWGIRYTNIQKFWKQGSTGKGVRIAIVDTGIDVNHPDLKGSIYGSVNYVKGAKSGIDDNGHGTHVAGIIAAKDNSIGSVGIAPGARLYSVKVMNKDGIGSVSDISRGIRWSIDHKMQIINLSLGMTDDELGTSQFRQLEKVLNEAYRKGILIVAASGNDGVSPVEYPANFPSVIAVGAASEGRKPVWADFSNYSNKIEVIAPGDFVYSTIPRYMRGEFSGRMGYDYYMGTSMASPYVAGFLAILKQRNPHYSASKLRTFALRKNVMDIGTKGKDDYTGYGFIYAK